MSWELYGDEKINDMLATGIFLNFSQFFWGVLRGAS